MAQCKSLFSSTTSLTAWYAGAMERKSRSRTAAALKKNSAVWAAHRPEADGVKAASACAEAMSSTSTQPKPIGGTAGQFLPSMNFFDK